MRISRFFARTILGLIVCLPPVAWCFQTEGTTPNSGQNQAQSGQPAVSASVPRIGSGSVIPVQLVKTVDAKKAKTGDEVEAKVT